MFSQFHYFTKIVFHNCFWEAWLFLFPDFSSETPSYKTPSFLQMAGQTRPTFKISALKNIIHKPFCWIILKSHTIWVKWKRLQIQRWIWILTSLLYWVTCTNYLSTLRLNFLINKIEVNILSLISFEVQIKSRI